MKAGGAILVQPKIGDDLQGPYRLWLPHPKKIDQCRAGESRIFIYWHRNQIVQFLSTESRSHLERAHLVAFKLLSQMTHTKDVDLDRAGTRYKPEYHSDPSAVQW